MLSFPPEHQMQRRCQRPLPDIFCWTKMGTEAGQTLDAIIRRKEFERRAGNGVFAWGIGNSLGESVTLARQLSSDGEVEVVFTPMKSAPKQNDISPAQTFLWLGYVESNGRISALPGHLLITSRGGPSKRTHYALLCHSNTSIQNGDVQAYIYAASARNLASSNPIGASQVTSMVRYGSYEPDAPSETPYKVAFRASLHQQGFLKLAHPVHLNGSIAELYQQACSASTSTEWLSRATEVRRLAQALVQTTQELDLLT